MVFNGNQNRPIDVGTDGRRFATIVAACSGFIAAFGYGYVFRDSFDPNVRNAGWSPEDQRLFECIIVFWSAASASGRVVYSLIGAKVAAATVKTQIGSIALILHVVGACILLVFLGKSLVAGQPFQLRDLLTVGIAVGLLTWAMLDWLWPKLGDTASDTM